MLNTETTMAEAFRLAAAGRSGQEALVCGGARLTYGELLARVEALARGLDRVGIGKGDKVVCRLPPGPDFVTLFFALARLGAVIAPLNPQTRRRGLKAVLRDVEPAALVTVRAEDAEALSEAAGSPSLILAEGKMQTLFSSQSELIGKTVRPFSTAALVAAGEGARFSPPQVSPDDLLALLYTSGTTGAPKGAMHSHRSLIAPVAASLKLRELWMRRPSLATLGQSARALARYRTRLLRAAGRPQAFLSTVGWHTITGLEVMLQGLLMGDKLVVMPRFHPRQALELIERERVTVLVAIPLALQMMLGLQGLEAYDTSSLLICGTGAAPCPPELARQLQERFGCAVHIGFGATETAGGISATSLADTDERQAATVGRPMPGVEVKIVDAARRELPPGQVGELACRGEGLMLGYYGAPEDTAEVLDADGWYYTGDLAVIDDQGYLRIVGRKKDVIIRGGQNIYPPEIEAYLAAHPKVREAAVVGIPAPLGGQAAWAFVLLEAGQEMTARELLDYCRAELEAYKIPGRVRFVDEFPRSETGKPQKFKLREAALRETQEAEHDDGKP